MAETVLQTENLSKKFGDFTAVDGVDFAIERGEVEALIGPNGAGKTTFQNLITGKLDPTEGRVLFDGDDITALDPHQRARRGIVRKYQITSVYESESVVENIRIALRGRNSTPWSLFRTHSDDDITDRIDELLDIANLRSEQATVAKNLSYGEKQWLEIVMAVGANPDLLLLDEPTSGMSVGETNETIELIERIRENEDVSLLVIEHDMEFIRNVSNSLTVLHHGEIIARGTAAEIESNEKVQQVYLKGE